ncbi:MAG: cob(I)yrinic acid a,c-diamide adenosyltransferase [Bifidobacteriaceae bacterium]|jgi:cob(I)alamin adenosyltransferase|nr:cob(I)yrinic acid a,c-diamide adenosyltransferase [Bifidobacteriaceae bacterium]
MVVLSRITTKTGDDGLTHLGDFSRASKTDPRIEAVGSVAEANAILGVAVAFGLDPELSGWTGRLQQELFDLGADLATPLPAGPDPGTGSSPAVPESGPKPGAKTPNPPTPRIVPAAIEAWDQTIGQLADRLGPVRAFILPGGPPAAAQLHLAVTVVRRAERAAWAAGEAHGIGQAGGLNRHALVYLNRLSDLLFQMARAAGGEPGLWRPSSS